MNKTIVARSLRLLLVACFVAAVFPVVIGGVGLVLGPAEGSVVLPFLAAAVTVAGLPAVLAGVDRLVQRLAHDSTTTPYSALAEAAARIRGGSLDEALPGLARVLGEGTGAQRAELWLAVGEKLVSAASWPPAGSDPSAGPRTVDNLAVLLAGPDADHVVPVLDGPVLRAVLAIGKPGRPVTPADQRLMQDVANGAGILLRGVALNAELTERVRRADELAAELAASRQRLTQARDVERRRLVAELGNATSDRLATLRADLADAGDALEPDPDSEAAGEAIARARVALDELLDRFRVIARGVYPAVLRDQGPYGALDEVATDLPRPVQLTGRLPDRLAWEVESGIYYLAASAMRQLAGRPARHPLRVHLAHADGALSVRLEDPTPPTSLAELRAWLADDGDRLAALGGDLEVVEDDAGGVVLRAWLPDQLEPAVERLGQLATARSIGPS
ncbi:hypothetical protein [Pseudonocardia acaciae]|uniref:hypothetical protein n=1 Tax=Pseudonocardia acaciae TaxID=551276 RepID=UPI00048EA675|nr:hypothetical protein [Pseudonocardia acaciae]